MTRTARFLAIAATLVCGWLLLSVRYTAPATAKSSGRPVPDCVYLPLIQAPDGPRGVWQGMSSQGPVQLSQNPCAPGAEGKAATIVRASPADGEGGVAVTRETIVEFDRALDAATVTPSAITAQSGGAPVAARIHLSPDKTRITLFYDTILPDGATVQATVDGDILKDEFGQPVDADEDGTPGGKGSIRFQTLSLAQVAGTAVCGRVVASEIESGGTALDRPLQGATITVDGAEATLRAVSDADGQFCLDPAPGSRFFVHVDGRTVTAGVPDGAFYPFVGKAWDPVPGARTNIGTVYLPLVVPGTLQAISETEDTLIGFPQSVLDENPGFAGVAVTVPAGSLFADDGTRGGQVGIAPVAPDRLPGTLPSTLNFPIVITVQTDGATNFDIPAPVCFPNLPDPTSGKPLNTGEGSSLVSFNHDTGRWEVVGPMTVTEDGALICTDPGVGVRAPGWHGAQAGNGLYGGGAGAGNCAGCDSATDQAFAAANGCIDGVADLATDEALGLALSGIPGIGCAIGVGRLLNWANNCRTTSGDATCTTGRAVFSGLVTTAGCLIPAAGTVLGLASTVATCMDDAATALESMNNCQGSQCAAKITFAVYAGLGFVPLSLDNTVINEQIRLLDAYDRMVDAMLGNPKWNDVPLADNVVLNAFYVAVFDRMADGSQDGILISPAERSALVGLSRPGSITEADVNNLVDRMNALANGDLPVSATDAMTAAAENLEQVGTELAAAGWESILDGLWEAPKVVADAAGVAATPVSLFYKIENLDSGAITRGRLGASGTLDSLIVPPNSLQEIGYLHPTTLDTATVLVRAGSRGDTTRIPVAHLSPSTQPDPDGDGLADDGEAVVGTDATRADSDGDGINDGDEIRAGTDPLGFPFEIGEVISATIDTPDEINRYTFTARGGQSIFFDTQGFDGFVALTVNITDDRGEEIYSNWIHWDPLEVFTLTRGGAYKIQVGDGDDAPSPYQFQVWDVPAPDRFAISVGDTVSDTVPGPGAGNIETPAVRDIYTFAGEQDQALFFESLTPGGFIGLSWRLFAPDGTELFNRYISDNAGPVTLPASGTYSLVVGSDNDVISTYHFRIVEQ